MQLYFKAVATLILGFISRIIFKRSFKNQQELEKELYDMKRRLKEEYGESE